MKLLKTEYPDFYKDEVNGGVINTNVNAYKLYKQQRDNERKNRDLNKEVADLKNELQQLKKLILENLRDQDGNTHS